MGTTEPLESYEPPDWLVGAIAFVVVVLVVMGVFAGMAAVLGLLIWIVRTVAGL